MKLSNITVQVAIGYIAELGGMTLMYGRNNAYFCMSPFTGPPSYARAGVIGRIIDATSGLPITNATIVSWPNHSNEVAFRADGTFVAAVDYIYHPLFADGLALRMPDQDRFEITIVAPGYEDKELPVDNGRNRSKKLFIELNPRK